MSLPDVREYLKRIGVEGVPSPTPEALRLLQSAHMKSVPYENIDCMLGREISLDIGDIYNKIVVCGRGGYCFENNALFSWLLKSLGFDVTDHFARVLRGETSLPMKRHHIMKVYFADEVYIADVGVGGYSPMYPLLLRDGLEQRQGGDAYRLETDSFLGHVIWETTRDGWGPMFAFTDERQAPVDFRAINYFCSHSPDSPFTRQYMAALRYDDGRVTLRGDTLRIERGGSVEKRSFISREALFDGLREYFGIDIKG